MPISLTLTKIINWTFKKKKKHALKQTDHLRLKSNLLVKKVCCTSDCHVLIITGWLVESLIVHIIAILGIQFIRIMFLRRVQDLCITHLLKANTLHYLRFIINENHHNIISVWIETINRQCVRRRFVGGPKMSIYNRCVTNTHWVRCLEYLNFVWLMLSMSNSIISLQKKNFLKFVYK